MARTLLRLLLFALVFGTAIEAPFLAYDAYKNLSRAAAFERLRVGLPLSEALDVIARESIACDLAWEPQANTCTFSDFWRTYRVSIDPHTNRINARGYQKKQRRLFLFRLFGIH